MNKTLQRCLRNLFRALVIVVVFFILPVGCQLAMHYNQKSVPWWELRRDSSGQTPTDTADTAVIQVYSARAARWRGAVGVHSWVTYKRAADTHYNRVEVIGYHAYYGRNAVRLRRGSPDAYWFGSRPTLLREIVGQEPVEAIIDRIEKAAKNYPYSHTYQVWPGPNSNTFIAWLARQVPELRLELPPHAIGKDYLAHGAVLDWTPSQVGAQLSFGGYAGVLMGLEEGLEFNVMGLTAGVDFAPLALKLPGIGRIGYDDVKRYSR